MAQQIVDDNTTNLVNLADTIVRNCRGSNCNTSPLTRHEIRSQLEQLGHKQATLTLTLLNIPTHSILGREIYDGYANLSAAVASAYSYHCGGIIADSYACVTGTNNVKLSQDNLVKLLEEPVENSTNNIIIITMLVGMGSLAFIGFFIFLMFAIFASTPKILAQSYQAGAKSVAAEPTDEIVLPASPL